jgi:hypothetical protein
MRLNGDAVDCLNRRYVSTNLHGIASQTTVVIIFVNTLIFTVRCVMQRGTVLNKTDTAMCDDDVATVLIDVIKCFYGKGIITLFIKRNICHLLQEYIYKIIIN